MTVKIAGAENDTLTADVFSTNDTSSMYTYTGRYEANTTGDYDVTLTDATATDDQAHDDDLTAMATIEPLLTNATLTDTTDQNAIVSESDRVTITAEVSSAANSVTTDASTFGAKSVSLNTVDDSTYEATIDVAVSNVTEQRRVPVSVSGVSGREASDTTNSVLIDTEPPAVDVGNNRTVNVETNVSLSPVDTTEPTTRIVAYEWSVDGSQQRGENITTAFDNPGNYSVRLAVTDAAGNVGADGLTITVEGTGTQTTSTTEAPTGGGGGGGGGGFVDASTTAQSSPTTSQPETTTTREEDPAGSPPQTTTADPSTTPTNTTVTETASVRPPSIMSRCRLATCSASPQARRF